MRKFYEEPIIDVLLLESDVFMDVSFSLGAEGDTDGDDDDFWD